MDNEEYQKIVDATNKAIKQGWDHTRIEWQRMALNTIYNLCLENTEISANDFSLAIIASPLKTHDNRAIGGAVQKAKSFKWIEATNRTVIKDLRDGVKGHVGPTARIWKSLIYKPTTAKLF